MQRLGRLFLMTHCTPVCEAQSGDITGAILQLWPEDEKNLLYVAITRAKTNLVMNDLLKFELLQEYLLRLSTYAVGEALTCSSCGEDLSDSLVPGQIMVTEVAHTMSGHSYTPGAGLGSLGVEGQHQHPKQYFCSDCSSKKMPAFLVFIRVSGLSKKGVKRKRSD